MAECRESMLGTTQRQATRDNGLIITSLHWPQSSGGLRGGGSTRRRDPSKRSGGRPQKTTGEEHRGARGERKKTGAKRTTSTKSEPTSPCLCRAASSKPCALPLLFLSPSSSFQSILHASLPPCFNGDASPGVLELYSMRLCCVVVYSTLLYCIGLYCIVLCCIVLCCIVLYCIAMYGNVLYCVVLYCVVLCRIVSYCIVLYCVVFCCIVLYLYCV